MTKYLIVKCEELSDQYECDADREPMFLVDDWEDWFNKNHPTYQFEVYKFVDDEEAELVKQYVDSMNEGMALYYWDNDEVDHEDVAPTVIARYKDYGRHSTVPEEVWKVFRQGAYWSDGDEFTEKDFKKDLKNCGYVSWVDKEYEKYWVYGHYEDGRYDLGY